MKYINATDRKIVYNRVNNLPVVEIKSYDELNELPLKTKVTIMHNISMNIGKIYSKEEGYILIDDNVKLISVYPDSFKYGNFMYKIMR